MSKGWRIAIGATLGVLLASALLRREDTAGEGAAETAAPSVNADQAGVRLFWERYREATRLRVAGRTAEAAAGYSAALELDDSHEDALYYLGNLQLELGRHAEAERAWRRLVEVNPEAARAHARLGELRLCVDGVGLRDLSRAEGSLRRALEINQEETGPLLRLGQLALLEGRAAEAASRFAAVLGSDAENDEAHYFAGFLAWKAGEGAAAADHFAAALRARGTEAGGPLVGEGDTKDGRPAPRPDHLPCQPFQPHVDTLRDGADPPAMDESYRALDATLARHAPTIARR